MPSITLRPHQIAAADAVEAALRAGIRRPLVDACVGAGKSLIYAELARRALARNERVIIGAHTRELVEQNAEACRMLMPNVHVGINAAALNERTWRAPVISAAIQSIYNVSERFGAIDMLCVDEAHLLNHTDSGMYHQLWRALRFPALVGGSGTTFRLQGGSLVEGENPPFDRVVYTYTILDGIRDGYLCEAFSIGTDDAMDPSRLKTRNGDYTGESQDDQMIAAMDNHIMQIRHHGQDRRSWLIFEASTKATIAMAARMNEWGIPTGYVLGKTPAGERAATIAAFKTGRLRALVNLATLTTGFNVPQVDLLVMRRRTKSLGLYIQICLDSETEILSSRGWLRREDVRDEDFVASFNTGDGSIEWCPILNRVDRPLEPSESMFGVESHQLNIRVTDQHDMIVKATSNTCVNWQKETASAMSRRPRMHKIPVAGVQYASGAMLTDDEIRLVGWYLSDGCINKKTDALQIGQSDKHIPHCAELRRVLVACGLKFGECVIKRIGAQSHYAASRVFSVSKGVPRGRDKHLQGWAHLEPWFDKNIGQQFEKLDARQLLLLISGMWWGDGTKSKMATWTVQTATIAMGNNRIAADRLQSLCVRRGLRCNITKFNPKASEWNQNPKTQYLARISSKLTASLPGVNDSDGAVSGKKPYERSRFQQVSHVPGERVWCVETRLGTVVTRRQGNVAIVGNCGRALRTAPEKQNCWVLDFAGNIDQHGPLDCITPVFSKARFTSCEDCGKRNPSAAMRCMWCGAEMTKNCPACLTALSRGIMQCTACNYDMRSGARDAPAEKLLDRPSGAALLSSHKTPDEERSGGWIPIRKAWEGGAVDDVNGDRWDLPAPLVEFAAAARWIRKEPLAIMVPNGKSRASAWQIAADGSRLIIPIPPQIATTGA